MKRLTINDVARLAFVSRSVVSRVLNNKPNVSKEARERVLEVIEKYNYRPNSAARSLVTDRRLEICVLVPRQADDILATGFWPLVLLGISEAASELGYSITLATVSLTSREEVVERTVESNRFDAFVMITRDVADLMVESINASGKPCVMIGHDPAYDGIHSVDVDNEAGAYLGVEHLVDLGHETIGIIHGPADLQETDRRRKGYERALREGGLTPPAAFTAEQPYTQEGGYRAILEWHVAGGLPNAVFCASDAHATGALLALYELGVRVPDDIAVVGFDGLPSSRYAVPPLTTVEQPIYDKGRRAAAMVVELLGSPQTEVVHELMPATLCVRASTVGRDAAASA
ncbi:MAG: LacI family DNA-binding transcriptional regulator [Bacteroidota bacterium]